MKEEKKVVELNLDDILPNRFQPRIRFDEEAINELAESIKEHGVIQPIVVRPIADKYEIIAGERRYKASMVAGKNTIPAIVTDLDDKESAEVALIENVQRQDLTPIEEAVSYKKILDMGYLTQNQLADKLGKDQSTIANKLRLLNLDEEVQEALLDEKISERHARSLLKISQPEQKELLHKIIEKRLTVRKTDEEINKILGITPKKAVDKKESTPKNNEIEVFSMDDPAVPIKEEPMKQENINSFNIPDTSIIDDVPTEQQTVNPGFMDINKIEETATDIYQEKPTANIDNLLEPSEIAPAPAKPEEPVEEDLDLRPGKFFNLLNADEDQEKVEPVPSTGFDFGGFNTEPILTTPETTPVGPANNVEETPVENNTVDHSVVTPSIDTQVPSQDRSIETFTLDNSPISSSTGETLDLNQQSIPETTIPDYSFELETEPTVQQPITPAPMNTYVAGDLKTVINTIRNCADTIEKFGFVVDVDEFDFEDMYQVIFKIEKKK